MMNKTLLLFIAVSLMTACSSKPKTDTPAEPVAADDVWDKGGSPAASTPMAEPARVAPTPAPLARGEDPWAELNAAIKSQNEESIRAAAEKIVTRVPNDDRALNALAMVHYRKGQFDHAIYLLDRAIGAHPKKAELYSNVGLVQLAKNERNDAVKSFRKAVELNADDGVSNANLGAIYVAEKDYHKAAVVLETAYKRGPRDPKTLNNYGISLAATGKGDKAKSVYEEALKDSSNNREVMLNYAILLVDHLGQTKEGLDVINRLKFLGPGSESRERLSILENKAKAGVK